MNPSPEAVKGGFVDVKPAMQALLDFVNGKPLAKLGDSGSGGTPNMRFFRALWAYLANGMVAPLLAFLQQQEEEGHCLAEPFSASHGHMHCACAGVALWWATWTPKGGGGRGPRPAQEAELVAALTRWWQREFRLCELMPGTAAAATAKASGPWGPGARDKDAAPNHGWAGSNEGRSIAYKVVQGGKLSGGKDKGNVGALALSKLSTNVRAELLFLPRDFVLAGELRVAEQLLRSTIQGERVEIPAVAPLTMTMGDYIGWFPNGLPVFDAALAAGVWDGKVFISEQVDQAALDRIALCGPPVVIPAARPF
jgi:hypothetical protein